MFPTDLLCCSLVLLSFSRRPSIRGVFPAWEIRGGRFKIGTVLFCAIGDLLRPTLDLDLDVGGLQASP